MLADIDIKIAPIRVCVGEEQQLFYVHEDLIRKRSRFFDSALNKEWSEGQDRVVKLPDDEPRVVELYIKFMYGVTISDDTLSTGSAWEIMLAKMYVLGEKLLDTDFQNKVVTTVVRDLRSIVRNPKGRTLPDHESINILYQGTPSHSPMRRLLADFYALFGTKDYLQFDSSRLNHEFLFDISTRLMEMRGSSSVLTTKYHEFSNSPSCSYHQHTAGEECAEKDGQHGPGSLITGG